MHLSLEALGWCIHLHPRVFVETTKLSLNDIRSFSSCIVVLQDKVKNFYTRLPFQMLTGISIRNKVPMSDKSISTG